MAVWVAQPELKFCSQAAVYVTAKVLAGITAELKERCRRYGRKRHVSVWYVICLCGMRKNSSSNWEHELCQRAQSAVARKMM